MMFGKPKFLRDLERSIERSAESMLHLHVKTLWEKAEKAKGHISFEVVCDEYARLLNERLHPVRTFWERLFTGKPLSEHTSDPTDNKSYPTDKWDALVKYDAEISAAAEKLRPYGDAWVDKLGRAYFALSEDRKHLSNIVSRLIEEAERDKIQRWMRPFQRAADGNFCTEDSLNILWEAKARGYVLHVEKDGTFTATKNGTSYLRSNYDIGQFGRFAQILQRSSEENHAERLVSFRQPMSFPKGTTLYETEGPRVAVLPDYSLIMDDGGLGGRAFESANEYRAQTGDRGHWNSIKTF